MLSLPMGKVYIYTEDGRKECVAMSDTLQGFEAVWFRERYTTKDTKVVAVALVVDGRIVRKFEF